MNTEYQSPMRFMFSFIIKSALRSFLILIPLTIIIGGMVSGFNIDNRSFIYNFIIISRNIVATLIGTFWATKSCLKNGRLYLDDVNKVVMYFSIILILVFSFHAIPDFTKLRNEKMALNASIRSSEEQLTSLPNGEAYVKEFDQNEKKEYEREFMKEEITTIEYNAAVLAVYGLYILLFRKLLINNALE